MLTPLILIKFAVAASVPVTIGGLAYVATSPELREGIYHFLTSPGWPLRLCLVVFAALNWKNLPLAWTVRHFLALALCTPTRNTGGAERSNDTTTNTVVCPFRLGSRLL